MADYRSDETRAWQRAKKITIDNTYGAVPEILFEEELICTLNDTQVMSQPLGAMGTRMINPLESVDLLNPADDSVIGTSSYQDAYILLYSIYRKLTKERDGH